MGRHGNSMARFTSPLGLLVLTLVVTMMMVSGFPSPDAVVPEETLTNIGPPPCKTQSPCYKFCLRYGAQAGIDCKTVYCNASKGRCDTRSTDKAPSCKTNSDCKKACQSTPNFKADCNAVKCRKSVCHITKPKSRKARNGRARKSRAPRCKTQAHCDKFCAKFGAKAGIDCKTVYCNKSKGRCDTRSTDKAPSCKTNSDCKKACQSTPNFKADCNAVKCRKSV